METTQQQAILFIALRAAFADGGSSWPQPKRALDPSACTIAAHAHSASVGRR